MKALGRKVPHAPSQADAWEIVLRRGIPHVTAHGWSSVEASSSNG